MHIFDALSFACAVIPPVTEVEGQRDNFALTRKDCGAPTTGCSYFAAGKPRRNEIR